MKFLLMIFLGYLVVVNCIMDKGNYTRKITFDDIEEDKVCVEINRNMMYTSMITLDLIVTHQENQNKELAKIWKTMNKLKRYILSVKRRLDHKNKKSRSPVKVSVDRLKD